MPLRSSRSLWTTQIICHMAKISPLIQETVLSILIYDGLCSQSHGYFSYWPRQKFMLISGLTVPYRIIFTFPFVNNIKTLITDSLYYAYAFKVYRMMKINHQDNQFCHTFLVILKYRHLQIPVAVHNFSLVEPIAQICGGHYLATF